MISIPAGLYAIAVGLGMSLPPVNFQGKKYVALLGCLMIVGGLAGTFSNVQASKAEKAASYVSFTLEQNDLPLRIDDITTFDHIRSDKGSAILELSLDVPVGQDLHGLVTEIEASVIEGSVAKFSVGRNSGVS